MDTLQASPRAQLATLYRHAAALALVLVALAGCSVSGPSTARLVSIEYRPDDTSLSKQDTFFSYFDSGFLDKVEIEVDGDEVQEQLFNYEDERLASVVITQRQGDEAVEYTAEYAYDGDLVTSADLTYQGTLSSVYGPIDVDGGGEGTLEYNSDDRLLSSELTLDATYRQTVDAGGQIFSIRQQYESSETLSYTWDDAELVSEDSEAEEETVSFVDDVEDSRARNRTESSSDYSYTEGVLTEVEEETVYSQDGVDAREERVLDVEFNGDGQIREVTGTQKYADIESEYEVEITYDDEGRISRIEDQDGNRWSFDYDGTETMRGVTVSSNVLPPFIDIEGRQVFETISAQNHVRF